MQISLCLYSFSVILKFMLHFYIEGRYVAVAKSR